MKWTALIGRVEPALWGPPESYEWLKILPEEFQLVIATSGLQNLNREEAEKAMAQIEDSVRKLAEEGVGVIDVGGSPVLGLRGYQSFQKFLAGLKKITDIPLVTALTAEFDALKALGVKRVAVATPYPDDINQNRKQLLEECGFEVVGIKGLGFRARQDHVRQPDDASYRVAKEVCLNSPGCDGIYICCPGWPVAGNIARLEDELKKPVVANAQAQVWACLTALGVKKPIRGYGKLLTML